MTMCRRCLTRKCPTDRACRMGGASCPSCATRHSLGCWLKARCDSRMSIALRGRHCACLSMQEQRMAWLYHPIAEHPSSSSDKVYTVCIREDDRITDADERRRAAILTCCCPGWTRRCPSGTDESRTCRHVEQEAEALRRFKADVSAKIAQPAAPTAPKSKVAPATAPRQSRPERVDATEWVTLTEAPKVRSAMRAALEL